jgi:hypothetical protein
LFDGIVEAVGNPIKRVFFLLTPTATIAAILMSGITPAPAQELVVTSMFNSVVVQRSPKSFNQQVEFARPPVDGRPGDRTPAGSRIAQPPVLLPEQAL